MKRIVLLLLATLIYTGVNAQISIAVMEFKPGSNMNSNLDGLSDMLINSLFDSGNYDIVERSQIEYALKELGIQGKNLSVAQLTKLGEYLKVDNVLVGTVNFIVTGNSSDPGFQVGEYNIDVRIVDVKTSKVIATAGVVKSSDQTYRSLMPDLARQLSRKLTATSIPKLQGYLYVYPEFLGNVTYGGAMDLVEHLNSINAYGRKNWRIPTLDEARLIVHSWCSEDRFISFYVNGRGNVCDIWISSPQYSYFVLSEGYYREKRDFDSSNKIIPVATD